MLRSVKALHGYTVLAKDGDIGKASDFYFHDDTWTIRYLVVDTGHWLPGRKVPVTHDLAVKQMLESLQGLTRPAGVEVLLHRGQTPPTEPEIGIEKLRPGAETGTAVLEKSSYLAENQPFAHWGINE